MSTQNQFMLLEVTYIVCIFLRFVIRIKPNRDVRFIPLSKQFFRHFKRGFLSNTLNIAKSIYFDYVCIICTQFWYFSKMFTPIKILFSLRPSYKSGNTLLLVVWLIPFIKLAFADLILERLNFSEWESITEWTSSKL